METPRENKQVSIIVLKGSIAYRDWLARLIAHSRLSGAALLDRALSEWAKRDGFKEPPPKR